MMAPCGASRFLVTAVALLGLLAVDPIWAARTTDTLQDKQARAQAEQGRLQERIRVLQKDITQQEASRKDAVGALRASETAISNLDRRLAELGQEQDLAHEDLQQLKAQISEQTKNLDQRQQELAELLRAHYASGLSPWTALLSGDDPQAIGRELGYLTYVSKAQAQAVQAVNQLIKKLKSLRGKATARETELAQLAKETRERKAELEEQKQERQRVLAKISDALKEQRSQAETLQRNDKQMAQLIEGLGQAIAKQAAEEARLAEIRRKEQERSRAQAAQRAEQARRQAQARADEQARQRARELAQAGQQTPDLTQPKAALQEAAEQSAAAREQPAPSDKAQDEEQATPTFASIASQGLRRGLPYPVKGEVQGRFGAQRPDGGVWRGIVLRAAEGAQVRAIAQGKVVYADWLKGFGNILILDHGAKYLSIYAYNQSLLKKVGQIVQAGDTLATVGSTGGQVESGLYFEIRQDGKPVNPLLWLAR